MQLVRFLMKLTSEYVHIELKNGTMVAGIILSVAPNMNTVLKDVKMTVKGEDPLTMDTLTLRGNSIRYFTIPETVNLDKLIAEDSRKPSTLAPPPKRPRLDYDSRGGGSRGGSYRGRGGRGSPRGRGPLRGGGLRGSSRGSYGGYRGSTRGARGSGGGGAGSAGATQSDV